MRRTIALAFACVLALTALPAPAHTSRPGADSKPASTDAPGQPYPQGDSERHATFRVVAPDAVE
jgi:hypothetical protein